MNNEILSAFSNSYLRLLILFYITKDNVRQNIHLQENELGKKKILLGTLFSLNCNQRAQECLSGRKVRSPVFISFTGQTLNLLGLKNEGIHPIVLRNLNFIL